MFIGYILTPSSTINNNTYIYSIAALRHDFVDSLPRFSEDYPIDYFCEPLYNNWGICVDNIDNSVRETAIKRFHRMFIHDSEEQFYYCFSAPTSMDTIHNYMIDFNRYMYELNISIEWLSYNHNNLYIYPTYLLISK